MSTELRIGKICGTRTVTREDGAVIHDRIAKAWADECIIVDFENIPIASVSFLDQAVGVLALTHDLVEINKKILVRNMQSFDERLLKDILTSRAAQRARPKNGARLKRLRSPRRRVARK